MGLGIVENLIEQLSKLPGIGRKSAQRLAFFVMAMPDGEARQIAQAIVDLKERARFCRDCFNICEGERCPICEDPRRDRSRICVVEEPSNLVVIERSRGYRGLYHVLLGTLSPMDGMNPDELKIRELVARCGSEEVEEVILATNPTTKGEATAQYIAELVKPMGVRVSRIAYGLPIGGDIEFADEVTLTKSLEGRREL